MKLLLVAFFSIFFVSTFAEEVFDQRQNYFLTQTDYKITPKVNPITGEYSEEEVDLIVAGSEPLSIRRFYNHLAPYDARYASWRYNPECFFVANFQCEKQEIFASIGERDGTVGYFTRSHVPNKFHFEVKKGFVTSALSGQNHPLNTQIKYETITDKKNKRRFQYFGKICEGSGRVRTFKSYMHSWNNPVRYVLKKGFPSFSEKTFVIGINTWTPYHIAIEEERLPNGNIICYEFTRWQRSLQGKSYDYPMPQLLQSITAYNSHKTKILGSIHFEYKRTLNDNVGSIQAIGSDGRSCLNEHHVPNNHSIVLKTSHSPHLPPLCYGFEGKNLNTVEKPEGRLFKTEYKDGKVCAQYAPLGSEGELLPLARYEYHDNVTIVSDAEDHKTIYHFDENKKITCLETACYKTEFSWDGLTGNLLKKTIKDLSGKIFQITEYQYDKNQNPILEKIGDGKNSYTITRTFSDDGFNLKLKESDQNNRVFVYSYVPHTNLLASELVYEGSFIRKRTFHSYDDCAILRKTIIDDGKSKNPSDLTGITYRKIFEIKPKESLPCFGLPEVLIEKTMDASGKEILLKKIVYTYASCGKILKEEHYDADDHYCYSLNNSYDEKERLSSQTDALGHKVYFSYDANNNLISIKGPESQEKIITYDKANRPIEIAEKQSDGSFLKKTKRYDKLGQLIAETDVCGHETRYEYDALGRKTVTYFPDGGCEKKKYDVLGNVIKEIDPLDYITTKSYNFRGQVLKIKHPDGSEEAYSYNPSGTVHTYVDKNGLKSTYSYDIFNNLIKTVSASKTISSTFSPFSKLSETDAEGVTTFYTYDYAGRKIQEKKSQHCTDYEYDSLGRLSKTIEGDTITLEEKDFLGRIETRKILKNSTLQYEEYYKYDPSGNLTQITNSQGTTTTTFNTLGQPLSQKDALGFTTTFSYSFKHNREDKTCDPQGIETIRIYDAVGREIINLKRNAQGDVIQKQKIIYDKNGNQKEVIHTIFSPHQAPQNIKHTWHYGPNNRLESFIESGKKETKYLYDAKGRLQTIVKPNKASLHHEYDLFGRLSRFYSSDFDYNYTYNKNDLVTKVYDKKSEQSTTRLYDELGHLVKETLGNGLSLENVYDERGKRKKLILPDDSEVNYTYDGMYLHTVTRKDNSLSYSRNLQGLIIQSELPQNLGSYEIKRDALGRYKKITSSYFKAEYKYDPKGNLLHYVYRDQKGKEEKNYSYDDLDQLISENEHTYLFDSLYNRLKKDEIENTINHFCQITQSGATAYSYDLCGNLICEGEKSYEYDTQDRLIAIREKGKVIEFTYDPFHRRLSQRISHESQDFLWDGDHEIGSVKSGEIEELRVLGEGLGAEIGSAVLYEIKDKTYVPLHDHRGSLIAIIDLDTKKVKEIYRYDAFGMEETEGQISPWRFASKRIDETGLIFFGRRYYSAELGRWITQDPQGFEDGPNLYAYVHNSPLSHFDLFGLKDNINEKINDFIRSPFSIPLYPLLFDIDLSKYGSFETGLKNKSFCYDLKKYNRPELPNGRGIFFINGMNNTFEQAEKHLLYLSDKTGGYNITGIYNSTHGFCLDGMECLFGLIRGAVTDPVKKIHQAWDKFFDSDSEDKLALHFCTSHGAILTGISLENYPEPLRKRIRVIAIAPGAYISRDICHSVTHYVNEKIYRDFVPRFDLVGKWKNRHSINYVRSHPQTSFFDHSFASPTFEEIIMKEIENYNNMNY